MPRYYFDLVNSVTIADEGGAEASDDINALDVADEVARRVLRERPEVRGRHFAILVTNEDGEEVGRVYLDAFN